MILIVGGAHAGKRAFAERTFDLAPADIADGVLDGRPCIDNLQDCLRAMPAHDALEREAPADVVDLLRAKRVIICDEMGCGVIPLDPALDAWRERVGRTCCALAVDAEAVIRVCCGIPEWIKGTRG